MFNQKYLQWEFQPYLPPPSYVEILVSKVRVPEVGSLWGDEVIHGISALIIEDAHIPVCKHRHLPLCCRLWHQCGPHHLVTSRGAGALPICSCHPATTSVASGHRQIFITKTQGVTHNNLFLIFVVCNWLSQGHSVTKTLANMEIENGSEFRILQRRNRSRACAVNASRDLQVRASSLDVFQTEWNTEEHGAGNWDPRPRNGALVNHFPLRPRLWEEGGWETARQDVGTWAASPGHVLVPLGSAQPCLLHVTPLDDSASGHVQLCGLVDKHLWEKRFVLEELREPLWLDWTLGLLSS